MKQAFFAMKRIVPAVSVAAALFAAPAAYATTVNWGIHDETEFSQMIVAAPGSFEDSINFTLSPGSGLTSVAVSNNLPGSFLITNGNVDLWMNAATTTLVGTYAFSGTTGSTPHIFAALSAGDYTYKISGIAGSPVENISRGLYSITSSLNPVSPVPEPEIYAMLAAGLGLMGFISRRRARRTA